LADPPEGIKLNGSCHNLFFCYSPNFTFFPFKIKNNGKKDGNLAKTSRGGCQMYRKIKLQFSMESGF
jgi:hypothetical protein